METVETRFDRVKYIVPLIGTVSNPFEFDGKTHADYPEYCGPGAGWLADMIPDEIGKKKITVKVACHIHDVSWQYCDPTWKDFHATNSIFLHNLISAITILGAIDREFDNDINTALWYYRAVDTIGNNVFWEVKKAQEII